MTIENWEETFDLLKEIKKDIGNEAKRVLKKDVPKTLSIRNEIGDNLVTLFNKLTKTLARLYSNLDEFQLYESKKLF